MILLFIFARLATCQIRLSLLRSIIHIFHYSHVYRAVREMLNWLSGLEKRAEIKLAKMMQSAFASN